MGKLTPILVCLLVAGCKPAGIHTKAPSGPDASYLKRLACTVAEREIGRPVTTEGTEAFELAPVEYAGETYNLWRVRGVTGGTEWVVVLMQRGGLDIQPAACSVNDVVVFATEEYKRLRGQ